MILGMDAETECDVEKDQILARGKYLATVYLLRLDRRRYEELILSKKTTMTLITCGHVSRSRINGKQRQTSRTSLGYLKVLIPCHKFTTRT